MNLLEQLEAEAIYVLRETAAQFRRPALLFSGGKDSIVLAHLARRAFGGGRSPFPLLHVDTGHNFPEALQFRDAFAREGRETLVVSRVQDTIDQGRAVEPTSLDRSRNALQSITLLDAIAEHGFDALIGGARRDEEKTRAKERFFSFRDEFGRWDPRKQRPELWRLFNGRVHPGQHMRVFPLSNWTEVDVWSYIVEKRIEMPSLYFAHRRVCVRKRGGVLLAACEQVRPLPGESEAELTVRCRTVGDMTCTGLLESEASTGEAVLAEVRSAKTSERGTRHDDKLSDSAMEDRKRVGYF